MHGRIESFNAAVAGSILLYEATAQRRSTPPADVAPGDVADTSQVGVAGSGRSDPSDGVDAASASPDSDAPSTASEV
jgi:hypothetical protein